MTAGFGLSTCGPLDGPKICNKREGGSVCDFSQRTVSCECAAAATPQLSGSARASTVCPVQHPGGSSNSITVTKNTD
jgi:hypothetical protein